MRKKSTQLTLIDRNVILRSETERAVRTALEALLSLTPRIHQVLAAGVIYGDDKIVVTITVESADSSADSGVEIL